MHCFWLLPKWSTSNSVPIGAMVATESNVVAVLNANTGDIKWRHQLSQNPGQVLLDFGVSPSGKRASTLMVTTEKEMTVQTWNPSNGLLAGSVTSLNILSSFFVSFFLSQKNEVNIKSLNQALFFFFLNYVRPQKKLKLKHRTQAKNSTTGRHFPSSEKNSRKTSLLPIYLLKLKLSLGLPLFLTFILSKMINFYQFQVRI